MARQVSDDGDSIAKMTDWFVCLFSFQYYEMSYGLNIEMHKQVGAALFPIGHLGGWVGR